MRAKLALALLAAALGAEPLTADLTGITTTPLSFPAFASEMRIGPDGNIWILTDKGNLGKLTPGGTYTEFPVPWGAQQVGQSAIPNAQNLTTGIDGNLWLIGRNGHIASVTTAGGFTDFAVAPSFYYNPMIVSGADGALWFFDRPMPGAGASNVWKMGRIDIYGQVTTYDLGISNDNLTALTSGGDGNLWFIDMDKNQMVKFSITSGSVAGTFAIPPENNPRAGNQMVLGPDGNVWFTHGTSIDRATPDGTITAFHIPSGGQPAAIVAGGDGNVWFSEPSSGKLGQLVISTINGGSASFNESGAIAPDAYELFAFPGRFSSSGKLTALDSVTTCGIPCAGMTYIIRRSSPVYATGNMAAVSTPPPTACADVDVKKLEIGTFLGQDSLFIRVKDNGPSDAGNVTTTISLSGIQSIGPIDPSRCTATVSGTTVILNGLLACGGDYSAQIRLNAELTATSLSATAIAAGSVPDPDSTNNVKAAISAFGIVSRPLPPPVIKPITNPVQRGH